MSEFSKALDKQNNLIDKYKFSSKIACPMIDVKPSLRKALETYFKEMIGYIVQDNLIYFRSISWASDNRQLVASQFQKAGGTV